VEVETNERVTEGLEALTRVAGQAWKRVEYFAWKPEWWDEHWEFLFEELFQEELEEDDKKKKKAKGRKKRKLRTVQN
jgi:hypothetical protein